MKKCGIGNTRKLGTEKPFFSEKKNKIKNAVKINAFYVGSRNLVCTISIHIPTYCEKISALSHSGGRQFQFEVGN